MRCKNYDKAPLIFLSDIIYWETIGHPLFECMRSNLPFFNEYFVENFHSSLRRQTSHKILNHEGLRKDAFVVDALRKDNNFNGTVGYQKSWGSVFLLALDRIISPSRDQKIMKRSSLNSP